MKRKMMMRAWALGGVITAQMLCMSGAQAQASASPYTTGTRYDAMRRVTGTIAPDPDGAGPLGHAAIRNSYNDAGELFRVEKGQLLDWQPESKAPADWTGFEIFQTLETQYDAMGRKIRETARSGPTAIHQVTQYSYDLAGRLECTAVRMNPATFEAPPASACALGVAGTQGPDRITRNVYDAAGQLLQIRKAVGTPLEQAYATYSYTPNGKREFVIDANGNRAKLAYDGFDRQSHWHFPAKGVVSGFNPATPATVLATAGALSTDDYEQYGYDPGGNRTSLRKRDGQVIGYQYDALNRMTLKDLPGAAPDVHYGYDLRGLQLYARFGSASGEGLVTSYDGFGRLSGSSLIMDGVTRALSYEWDANGNRTRVTHPDGEYFSYEFDGLNRVSALREKGAVLLATFSYDKRGQRRELAKSNNTLTSYGYDGLSRLESLADDLGGSAGDVTLGFGYNPAGQMISRTTSNGSYVFGDDVNVNRGYAVNGLNQYVSAGEANFGYDANGNLTSDGKITYAYDVENRLVSVSGAKTAGLRYDPTGRLYETSRSATRFTRFLYDGDELIAEYDESGALLRRYVHGAGVDDPLVWYEGAAVGANRRTLQPNHQGSIVSVADASGNLVAINSFDPWGIPGATNLGRFQYTGQIILPEIEFYHYKARIYSPTLGRFLQTDPIGYDDQINLYAYVANDPVNHTDPDGMECQTPTGSRICQGAAVGAAARTATVGVGSERARRAYDKQVSGLRPDDRPGREAAKEAARKATPHEVRAVIEAKRPGLGPKPGSGGRANVTNPAANQGARVLGAIGKGAGVAGIALVVVDITNSENPGRAIVANGMAVVGGVLGGVGGAAAGTLGGPAAPVTVPAGGVAGSVAGGVAGYSAGEKLYDWIAGN